MASAADPYQTLGVAPSATDEELRTAYRRLVQRHHPDHNHGSPESAHRFAEIQEAYAHVRLLRATAHAARPAPHAPTDAPADPDLEARLAALERELAAARSRREQAAHAARREAQRAARREARRAPGTSAPPGADRPSAEELGYVTTDDSFSRILDDFADEVAGRFSEARDAPRPATPPRRPRSAAEWIEELGSRLTGERRDENR